MNELEARKKAEEWAKNTEGKYYSLVTSLAVPGFNPPYGKMDQAVKEDRADGYMRCFHDMTSGKQHGWGIKFDGELRSDTVGEYQFSSGYGNEVVLCFTDRTDAMDYIATILPTSAKIEIVPVKLIEVKEK